MSAPPVPQIQLPGWRAFNRAFAPDNAISHLRTRPEREPGHGGCPAINPRHRDPWWSRWRRCQELRHDRWDRRRKWLMRYHADFGLSVAEAAAKLPQPVWVAA